MRHAIHIILIGDVMKERVPVCVSTILWDTNLYFLRRIGNGQNDCIHVAITQTFGAKYEKRT